MIEFSNSFKLNEIHIADSPFNEDPKNVSFFQGAPNFGEGRSENLRKVGNNRGIYCYANRGVVNFERGYQPLPSGIKILVIPPFFIHARPNFRKKVKKLNFQAKF